MLFSAGVKYRIIDLIVPEKRNGSVAVTIPLFGKELELDLRENSYVLDSNFVILERYENSTRLVTDGMEDVHCFYVYHREGIKASLDLCGGGLVSFPRREGLSRSCLSRRVRHF